MGGGIVNHVVGAGGGCDEECEGVNALPEVAADPADAIELTHNTRTHQ